MTMAMGSFASRVVATKVVATDGTGDFTDIQSAINDLPAGGGVVYIKEGTYTITGDIVINKSNVALIGAGKSSKIVQSANDYIISADTKSGLLIQDLYLYGKGGAGVYEEGIWFRAVDESSIRGCWIENCGRNGILISASGNGLIITGNYIFSNIFAGIHFQSGQYCVVTNNHFYTNVKHGLELENVNNSLFSNNICRANDSEDSATYDGINLVNSDNNIIANNRCLENDRYEINIETSTCNKNLVHGNICLGTDHVGAINDAGTGTVSADNIIA